MSVLSRVNWTAQQRLDTHDLLMSESFQAFDIRALIGMLSGVDRPYVIRGLEAVGKTGLSLQFNVANSITFNPLDETGSMYVGLADDEDIIVDLPANQANIFIEARFRLQTQAQVTRAHWDQIAITGDDASGAQYSAATDTQIVVVLEISSNTIGFSSDAIPLAWAKTGAADILDMEDRRDNLFRLAKGGTTPDPLHKYNFSATRSEPVQSGTGVGDAADSPWRSFDSSGSLNDKAIRSFKDWADAMMTRICELSGSPIWYLSGLATAPVAGVSVNQLFFDTLGHNLQPSEYASFVWKRVAGDLCLCGEGTFGIPTDGSGYYHEGLLKWQSNYSKLEWHLGATFSSPSFRNYSSLYFASPAPDNKGNVYLKLEREVSKGSGVSVSWKDNTAEPSFAAQRAVSGNLGDFTGIALGDFIRKATGGYAKYSRVVGMSDGSVIYLNATLADENRIADGSIIALLLEDDIDSVSSEPLRYFRSRYSNDDLYADEDVATNGYLYKDADFYWLGRRSNDLFLLRGYGTMQENEEISTLDDSWMAPAAEGLVFEHAKQAQYATASGYKLKSGTGTLLTIYRRKRDNSVETPSSGDNSNALLSYTIEAPVGLLSAGESLWCRLSDTTSGAVSAGSVVDSAIDLTNEDSAANRWEILSAADTPLRTKDNQNVFLIARRLVIGGQDVLLFADGSVVGDYGVLFNQNVEITGELKLTPRAQTGVLFISDTIAGQVDDEAAQLFYNKTAGEFGVRTFRVTDNQVLLSASANVNFLTNLGNFTLTLGDAASTVYIPGDLVVTGNTVAIQVSQIQAEDKVITLGVGNPVDGGYDSGIEVADDTITGSSFDSTIGSPDVVITLPVSPGYSNGDIIGVSASTGIGGITAGEISGQYTIVASLTVPGDATISGTTLTVRTIVNAAATDSSAVTPPKVFKPEWSVKVAAADGTISGTTSWAFRVKGVTTTPTITPVADYGIVPTAHSANMQATRIPFVNNDNAGPSDDSTLNFTGNLTWDSATNTFSVTGIVSITGNIVPGVDDTYDLGTVPLRWNALYLGEAAGGGIYAGPGADINLYWASSGLWKTDDSFSVGANHYIGGYSVWDHQVSVPAPPATGKTAVWADDDGYVYQRTSDGVQRLLTNTEGNIFNELVTVASSPTGNNQMAAIGAPPTTITLPKDTKKLMGEGLVASTTNLSSTITVSRLNHGLVTGETVTVVTSAAIGGISGANLSVTNATVTVINPDTFTYPALAVASSTDTGSLDLVTAVSIRYYEVGTDDLEVYLNGQLQTKGVDWDDFAPSGFSNQITWLRTLVVGDKVLYRIDSNGGQYVLSSVTYPASQSGIGGGGVATPGAYPYAVPNTNGIVVLVDTTSARTLNLPSPTSGLVITIKDISGQASTNNILITRFGAAGMIEGVSADQYLSADYGSYSFIADGTNWWRLR